MRWVFNYEAGHSRPAAGARRFCATANISPVWRTLTAGRLSSSPFMAPDCFSACLLLVRPPAVTDWVTMVIVLRLPLRLVLLPAVFK